MKCFPSHVLYIAGKKNTRRAYQHFRSLQEISNKNLFEKAKSFKEERNQSSLHHAAAGDLVTSIGLTCKEFRYHLNSIRKHQLLKVCDYHCHNIYCNFTSDFKICSDLVF